MSLLTEIRGSVITGGTRCRVIEIRAALSEADRADLDSAISDASIPATAIASALNKRQIKVSDQSLNRHRRNVRGESGGCACPS